MTNSTTNMLACGATLDGGKYRIIRQIASGGFGNTYEAVNVKLNARCAVKELFIKGDTQREDDSLTVCVSNREKTGQFEVLKQKFRDEARRLSELRSDHIVQVFDLFDDNGTVYYVMQLIEGQTLAEIMDDRQTPLTEPTALAVLWQMLDALDVIHAAGIWHMDIKPSNIMTDSEGKYVLIDFGASKQTENVETDFATTSVVAYSPGFAPTEQISGNKKRWGPWTDYYELGATLYNMLTCRRPPLAEDMMADGAAAFSFPDNVSEPLRRLIPWMMSPAYGSRPQSTDEIRHFLNDTASGTVDASSQAESPKPKEKQHTDRQPVSRNTITDKPVNSPRRRLRGWLIAAAMLLALILLGYFLSRDVDDDSEGDIVTIELDNVSFKMVKVDAASTSRGAVDPFYVAQMEVTRQQWDAVMGTHLASEENDSLKPVSTVSWDDCMTFLSRLDSLTDRPFRMLTETEWELTARKSQEGLPVSGMTDNVAEWCFDRLADIPRKKTTDPIGAPTGFLRVFKGMPSKGKTPEQVARNRMGAIREFRSPRIGLRIAMNSSHCSLAEKPDEADELNLMGERFFYGMGVDRNPDKAFLCFEKASQQHLATASKNLAACYRWGVGTERDIEMAARLYEAAADSGEVNAQLALALCYYKGEGIPRSYSKALFWLLKAADAGHPVAQCHLAGQLFRGVGIRADHQSAIDWYAKSARQNYAPAQYILGLCYKYGVGVEKDTESGKQWLKKAATQNYQPAVAELHFVDNL